MYLMSTSWTKLGALAASGSPGGSAHCGLLTQQSVWQEEVIRFCSSSPDHSGQGAASTRRFIEKAGYFGKSNPPWLSMYGFDAVRSDVKEEIISLGLTGISFQPLRIYSRAGDLRQECDYWAIKVLGEVLIDEIESRMFLLYRCGDCGIEFWSYFFQENGIVLPKVDGIDFCSDPRQPNLVFVSENARWHLTEKLKLRGLFYFLPEEVGHEDYMSVRSNSEIVKHQSSLLQRQGNNISESELRRAITEIRLIKEGGVLTPKKRHYNPVMYPKVWQDVRSFIPRL